MPNPEAIPAGAWLSVAGCFLAPLAVATQVQYLSNPRKKLPTANRMAWMSLGHILVLLPIALWIAPAQVVPVSPTGFLAVLGIAILAATIPQVLFMVEAPRSCADKNALVGSLELVVALLTGAILIGQNLDRLEITAMVLIMLALFIKQVDVKTNHKALVYN